MVWVEFEGLGDPRLEAEQGDLLTFAAVQDRMVDAVRLWQRAPDRERGWQSIRSYWPDIVRHTALGDYSDDEAEPRPLPLTRAEVAEMNMVGEWLRFVPEADRRLVALALAALATGRKRVPWMRLRRAMGVTFGADALRKRYCAAISDVCHALNGPKSGRKQGGDVSTRKIDPHDDLSLPAPGAEGAFRR
jgi:hypothetical protein